MGKGIGGEITFGNCLKSLYINGTGFFYGNYISVAQNNS